VNGGFIEKGMPAWGKVLSPSEVRDVAFFVLSLQGSNPPNAKASQGELVKPDASPKTDSLKVSASL
jgi:cytochrome c oxidase cbb3-type subunit 3